MNYEISRSGIHGGKLILKGLAPTNICSLIDKEGVSSLTLDFGCQGLTVKDYSWFKDCLSKIKHIQIFGKFKYWEVLHDLNELVTLQIHQQPGFMLDFSNFPNLAYFEAIWGEGTEESLKSLSNIDSISLHNYPKQDLNVLGNLSRIKQLNLMSAKKLESLTGLAESSGIELIEFHNLSSIDSFEGLRDYKSLQVANLLGCTKLERLGDLIGSNLEELMFSCKSIDSLAAIKDLKKLKFFTFVGDVLDKKVGFLGDIENIRFLLFNDKKGFDVKCKSISKSLELRGFDQSMLRKQRSVFDSVSTFKAT